MVKWTLACALILLVSPVAAQQAPPSGTEGLRDLDAQAKLPVAESHVTATLQPNPRRLWVIDTAFPAAEASKTWIIDGNTAKIDGMFNMGYWPNVGFSPQGNEVYSLDSFWTKHTRGERHDYLTTRDASTLAIKSEVELPRGRFLIVTKKPNYDVTPDGRYGLSFNLAPATTVSLVDLEADTYRGEIPVPGCGLIFASAGNRFSTICSDGTMQTVTFSVVGDKVESSAKRTPKVFDAEKDPVFEHVAFDRERRQIYMVSYRGTVYPVDLSGEVATPQMPWNLSDDVASARTGSEEAWRPGGWQITAFNQKTQRLYVLMHQGPEWTHKDAATELWVVDVQGKKVEKRVHLKEKTISVGVSQEADPQIYTIAETTDILIHDADGKEVGKIEKLGFSPQLIYVAEEY
jgi:methylamine dehydrogenase heavy chain